MDGVARHENVFFIFMWWDAGTYCHFMVSHVVRWKISESRTCFNLQINTPFRIKDVQFVRDKNWDVLVHVVWYVLFNAHIYAENACCQEWVVFIKPCKFYRPSWMIYIWMQCTERKVFFIRIQSMCQMTWEYVEICVLLKWHQGLEITMDWEKAIPVSFAWWVCTYFQFGDH